MALTTIAEGAVAQSSVLNDNFRYLLSEIQSLAATVESDKTSLINSISTSVANLQSMAYSIGSPQITLKNTLNDGEIWLEGAVVSQTTYAALYEIYGTTYNTGDEETGYFRLPNFTDRVLQGASNFGYIAAGLPNITGSHYGYQCGMQYWSGCFTNNAGANSSGEYGGVDYTYQNVGFNAALSNSIYGNSTTVQPPAIKIRVKTRYR